MTPIIWSKFYYAEWQSNSELRACSLEARGFWLELLCIAAPLGGYLARGAKPLTVQTIAAIVREPLDKVERLMAELEENMVLRRDAKGRLYAPRLLQDLKIMRSARDNGRKGGRASYEKQKGIFTRLEGRSKPAPDSKSQESENKSQESEVTSQQSPPPRTAPLLRAVETMGTTIDAIHRKTAWMAFDYTFANWLEEGSDPERDIWPTIAALSAKLGRVPASPAYFTEAIREARDRRVSFAVPAPRTLGAPYRASSAMVRTPATPPFVDPQLQADRLKTFTTTGAWSNQWGPKPAGVGASPSTDAN